MTLNFVAFSQNTYPIQTILKNDSVVIYTLEQSKDIDLMLENQRALNKEYREKNELYLSEIDSLKRNIESQKFILDSLMSVNSNIDSLQNRIQNMERWLVRSSIDNVYLYMSWQDNKIKGIDMTVYEFRANYQTGNFRMVRRGNNNELSSWKFENYNKRESPEIGWEIKYWEENRPIVFDLPFSIKINDYIIR